MEIMGMAEINNIISLLAKPSELSDGFISFS
jgi:hypothetical protein